ncbi:MAG TPA: type II toxin-antitoxin system VapC family toxin [Rubrivivax sp.]|nr:type II toxin-antitoxin system VapC family toxin [Rubrivivax sp.]
MTAPRWLLDSNVVMDWLNSNSGPAFSGHFTRYLEQGAATSVITWMEVLGLGWRGHGVQSRADAERLLAAMPRVELDEAVVRRTIELRSLHAIKLPDAMIAASALTAQLVLVTRNVSDFSTIAGLVVRDPHAAVP